MVREALWESSTALRECKGTLWGFTCCIGHLLCTTSKSPGPPEVWGVSSIATVEPVSGRHWHGLHYGSLSLLFFGNLLSTVQKSIAVYAHETTPDQCRTGADGYMSASLWPIDTQLWDELHKASHKVLVRWKYQPPLFSIVGGATW